MEKKERERETEEKTRKNMRERKKMEQSVRERRVNVCERGDRDTLRQREIERMSMCVRGKEIVSEREGDCVYKDRER